MQNDTDKSCTGVTTSSAGLDVRDWSQPWRTKNCPAAFHFENKFRVNGPAGTRFNPIGDAGDMEAGADKSSGPR
jgi:hypothetical protein